MHYRNTLVDLETWSRRSDRKPLVIRGARQVGKTTLVRLFAEKRFETLAEVNFERHPDLGKLFAAKSPRKAIELLELYLGRPIVPGRTLLFLDELQAAPEVMAALRYFYEELPELHVVAAGSLLDLALEEPMFSVPVGRIEYLFLGPMSFGEVLRAAGKEGLAQFLADYTLGTEIPEAFHRELLAWLARFVRVGGMPEAVRAYLESGSFLESERVKRSVLTTFAEDFGKYGRRVQPARLRKVFERLPHLVGEKLKYVHVDREERSKDLGEALHLLTLARVAYPVRHTAANGVPLGAEVDERQFKVLCLDVGLMATATGFAAHELGPEEDLMMVHRGALAEQLVGQQLLYSGLSWEPPQLFYWMREKQGSSAEVDYVLSHGAEILPVEVKAGTTGRLKSLHLFLREKHRRFAVRLGGAPPSLLDAMTSLPDGDNVPFRLSSLPLYMAEEVRRLIGQLVSATSAQPPSTR